MKRLDVNCFYRGLGLMVVVFAQLSFTQLSAKGNIYDTVRGNSRSIVRSVSAAPLVTRAIVTPFPHLNVTITRKTRSRVYLNITPSNRAIPGTTYTVTLKHPARDNTFKVLVLNKGTVTNGSITVMPGEKKEVVIRGSGFGNKVRVRLSYCRRFDQGVNRNSTRPISGRGFGVPYNVRRGDSIKFWVHNNSEKERSCTVTLRDARSSFAENVSAPNFSGEYLIKSTNVQLTPKPSKPVITSADLSRSLTASFSWSDNSGTADYYVCSLVRTSPREDREQNMGRCSDSRSGNPYGFVAPTISCSRNVTVKHCEFSGLKWNMSYKYSVIGVKRGQGTIKVYSDAATGSL